MLFDAHTCDWLSGVSDCRSGARRAEEIGIKWPISVLFLFSSRAALLFHHPSLCPPPYPFHPFLLSLFLDFQLPPFFNILLLYLLSSLFDLPRLFSISDFICFLFSSIFWLLFSFGVIHPFMSLLVFSPKSSVSSVLSFQRTYHLLHSLTYTHTHAQTHSFPVVIPTLTWVLTASHLPYGFPRWEWQSRFRVGGADPWKRRLLDHHQQDA